VASSQLSSSTSAAAAAAEPVVVVLPAEALTAAVLRLLWHVVHIMSPANSL